MIVICQTDNSVSRFIDAGERRFRLSLNSDTELSRVDIERRLHENSDLTKQYLALPYPHIARGSGRRGHDVRRRNPVMGGGSDRTEGR